MQQQDTPQNLYDHPANLFVGCFIGTPQMNVFKVRLEKRGMVCMPCLAAMTSMCQRGRSSA